MGGVGGVQYFKNTTNLITNNASEEKKTHLYNNG